MKFSARTFATMAAVTVLTPALTMHGQQMTPGDHAASETPRVELFVGFSYLRGAPSLYAANRLSSLYGGTTSVAFNLNHYLGFVTDFSGYRDSEVGLIGPGAQPLRVVASNGTAYSLLFGPRFSYRNHSRFTPFAQSLVGDIRAGAVTLANCTGAACNVLAEQDALAVTAGLGLDIRINRHVAFRAVQAEYLLTRFPDSGAVVGKNQNDVRLSSGLVFRFGSMSHPAPPPDNPPTAVCSANPSGVIAGSGDAVTVRAQASDMDNDPLTYSWSASSGTIEGSGAEVHWNSAGTTPGMYTVSLLVSDGRGGMGQCSSNIRVDAPANHPPTLTCSAERSSITAGDMAQITAMASDPDNDSLTYSWETSGGAIAGSGSSVRFDSTGLPSARYMVTGHVNDGHGGVATCTVPVDVSASLTILENKLALHSIYFATAQPKEGNPDGGLLASQKHTLLVLATDFLQYLQSKPQAHLTLEGHADPRASAEYNQRLTERRVETTRRFLVANGVPPANLEVKAFGDQRELSQAEVRDEIERNPDLDASGKQRILANINTIYLASNRRVDVVLSTNGQQSIRKYPFNAVDAMTLLKQK